MDNAKREVEVVQKLHAIEDKLAYFVVHCLAQIKPEALMEKIHETIAENRKLITGVSERILENYSIIQACANAFYASLGVAYLEKYGIYAGQIRADVLQQQAETQSVNVARTFTQVVVSMVREGQLAESNARINKDKDGKETLVFSLPSVLPQVRRFARQADIAVVDEKTLAKNLSLIGAEHIREYWQGKRRFVWTMVITESGIAEKGEGE
jgi:hypothetical protein